MAPHCLCLPSPGLLAMAVWFSLSSGLVTTMEVSGVTKWYLRDSFKAWAVRFSLSSPRAFLLWEQEGREGQPKIPSTSPSGCPLGWSLLAVRKNGFIRSLGQTDMP